MTDDEERTLARELHARADAIAVPWVPLRHRRPVGSRVAVFAALAAVLIAAVLAGGALNARRLSAVASPAPTSSTSVASPTTAAGSALTPDAARMLVVNLGGLGLGLRTETDPTPFFRVSGRTMLAYAVSADGRLAYWKAGRDDALPQEVHVYDTATRSDRTVLTLADERGGSQGFLVWSTDGTGLALSVSDANAIFEGRGSPGRPTRSSWRLLDVSTGTVRTIGTISGAWYVPVSWDRRTGVATATEIGRDGPSQPTRAYYVFDPAHTRDSASALLLPAAIDPFTMRADSGAQVALGIEGGTNGPTRQVLWVWPIADPEKAQRHAVEGRSISVATFRPRTTDVFLMAGTLSGAAGTPPTVIENWGPLGSAAPRAVAAQLAPLGSFSFFFRSDGTAIVAGNGDLNDRRGALIDPVTGATVAMPLADDILASIAPSGAAIPAPSSSPTSGRYSVRTASDVLIGLASDPFVGPRPADAAHGQPIFIKALRATDRDEWLVPIVRGGQVAGVVVVPIYENSLGSAGITTGWSGRFPHALTPEEAAAKVSTPSDPAIATELVWATVDPRQGGPASEVLPLYVVTLRSGVQWYVFNQGYAVEASQVPLRR